MSSLRDLFQFLVSFPSIGRFLAFQYSIDINYSNLCEFSEMSYVVPGPGSTRGIKKCFRFATDKDLGTIIGLVTSSQVQEFKKRGLHFQFLGNRKLQLIDIQNLFCEIDKYSREIPAYNPDGHRIKQKFKANLTPVHFVLPKKWNNSFFKETTNGTASR